MIVHIPVTQDDINQGARRSCNRCPIARAITRVLAPNLAAEIADIIEIVAPPNPLTGRANIKQVSVTPDHLFHFMSAFDKNDPVQPFAFEIDIRDDLLAPPPSLSLT